MNELKLNLLGGGIMTIRKTDAGSVMVEFFKPGENPDTDIGHGASMTATVFAATVRGVMDGEPAAATLDRETRLRMIAEAVDGMTRKDWQDASHKISRLFDYPATVAGNRVTIGRTADEIMNTLKEDF